MLRSLFVEFPQAKSHDAWAAIVWCEPQTTNPKPQTPNHKPQTTNHKPLTPNPSRFMLAMGYSDVMPLSMRAHVQVTT